MTVPEGMVWYNTSRIKGIRFPPGTYVLEAEDGSYGRLRSVSPLEFRTFNGGGVADVRNIPGGIMIGKAALSAVHAGGYIDDEVATKEIVWKLGGDFPRLEGRDWRKSF